MTSSVVELLSGTINASSTANFSITTSLVPSDVVVVAVTRRGSAETSIVSGFSASWTPIFSNYMGRGARADYVTGLTGSGTVSVQNTNTSTAHAVIWVLSGLNSPTLTGFEESAWSTTSVAANTDVTTPAQSFGADQIALAYGVNNAGTSTMPSNPTPATGWVADAANATVSPNSRAAHLVGTAGGTVQVSIRSSSSSLLGVVCMVFGSVATAPPLTSSFIGWGVDAGIA